MAVGSVHDVPHVWREVEGPSVVRSVNLEDATWQEVVDVVVGQYVLRRNRRRSIGAISDSERHAASMTRSGHTRWIRQCSTMRSPLRTRSPSSQSARLGKQTATGPGNPA